MTKITKLEMFQLSEKMWRWLAENSSHQKSEYYDDVGIRIEDRPLLNCYACEFTSQHSGSGMDCRICPMLELWGPRTVKYTVPCCDYQTSPFLTWTRNGDDEQVSQVAAKVIADFCLAKIKELECLPN